MINNLFSYLLESSFCLLFFVAAYRILVSNLTHFTWMRFYLLISVGLSIVLPFHVIPFPWASACFTGEKFINPVDFISQTHTASSLLATPTISQPLPSYNSEAIILYCILALYLTVVIYKTFIFSRNLKNIFDFIRQNPKVKEQNYWLVSYKNDMPAFSFFNYIFINNTYRQLSENELQVLKDHEKIHVKQRHTLDILFIELAGIVFWFNPAIYYLRKRLREIHEFIVDEQIAGSGENKKEYARLLLRLASETRTFNLAVNFTGDHIKQRVLMIAKQRTNSKYKMLFFSLVPITLILLFSFSCNKSPVSVTESLAPTDGSRLKSGYNGSWPVQLKYKDYCGMYLPSKKDTILKPMEILINGNVLTRFISAEKDPYNRTVYLTPEGVNKFSYMDNSGRSIEFIIDSENKVSGCILKRHDGTYTLFKQDC